MRPLRRFSRHRETLALLVAALAAAPGASAQLPERDQSAHVRYLALNVAIGTTAAVAHAVVTGAPLRTALAKGLLGGSLMSAGMELIGTQSRATRFAGLQLTAVGANVARNADAGVPLFSDLTLPVYPLYVRVRAGAATPITARVSVMSAARLISVMSGGKRPSVDWGQTVATGAPVFRSPRWRLPSASCPSPCEGSFAQHNAGIVVYSSSAGTDYDLDRTLAHESMHLAQQTRDALLDGIPVSDAALGRFGSTGRSLSRFFVVDAVMPLRLVDEGEARIRGARRRDSWYETEARAFAPGGQLH
jgi:hypothetical protein